MDPVTTLLQIQQMLLTTLATEAANPKPNYNLDGQSIDWTTYRKSLLDSIQQINLLIQMFQPTEFQTVAI